MVFLSSSASSAFCASRAASALFVSVASALPSNAVAIASIRRGSLRLTEEGTQLRCASYRVVGIESIFWTLRDRPLNAKNTAVQLGPKPIERHTTRTTKKAHTVCYEHNAHGIKIKRVIGFFPANFDAVKQHSKVANIRDLVDYRGSRNASNSRRAEPQLQLKRHCAAGRRNDGVPDDRFLRLTLVGAPGGGKVKLRGLRDNYQWSDENLIRGDRRPAGPAPKIGKIGEHITVKSATLRS
jgi:hypothetical protein